MRPVSFFAIGGTSDLVKTANQNWIALRDRWEYSHVARAIFATTSLILLRIAATAQR
jgi:hypothetical protein